MKPNLLGLLIGALFMFSQSFYIFEINAKSIVNNIENIEERFGKNVYKEQQEPEEMMVIENMFMAWQDKEYKLMLMFLDVNYTESLFVKSMEQANIPIEDLIFSKSNNGYKVTYKIPNRVYITDALSERNYKVSFSKLLDNEEIQWTVKEEIWDVKGKGNKFLINFHNKGIIPFFYTIGRNAGRNLLLEDKIKIIKNAYKKYYKSDDIDSSHVKPPNKLNVRFNTKPEKVYLEIDDEDYGLTPSSDILLTEGYHNVKICLNNVIIVNEFIEIRHNNKKEFFYRLSDYLIKSVKFEDLLKIGKPAVTILINTIKEETSFDKLCVVTNLLGKIGDGDAVKPLIDLLYNDVSIDVRINAIKALGQINDRQALEPICKIAKNDKDPTVMKEAKIICNKMHEYYENYMRIVEIVGKINYGIRHFIFKENFQIITKDYIFTLDEFEKDYRIKVSSIGNNIIKIDKDNANVGYSLDFDLELINKHDTKHNKSGIVFLNLKKENNSWKITSAKILLDNQSYFKPAKVNLSSSNGIIDEERLIHIIKKYNFFEKNLNENGNFENKYDEKSNDKVVVDNTTGLMWYKGGSENDMIWEKVEYWLIDTNSKEYAGYNNWRLPTIEEALSLLEPSQNNNLFIDHNFNNKQSNIWTGDRKGGSKVSAVLGVDYSNGTLEWYEVSNHKAFIRPVRSKFSNSIPVDHSKERNQLNSFLNTDFYK